MIKPKSLKHEDRIKALEQFAEEMRRNHKITLDFLYHHNHEPPKWKPWYKRMFGL